VDGRSLGSGPFWVVVLAVLGISAGGTLVSGRGATDVVGVASGVATAASSATAGSSDDEATSTAPRGFHRDLALVNDFLSIAPMYVTGEDGKVVLDDSFTKDVNGADACETTGRDEATFDRYLTCIVKAKLGDRAKLRIVIATLPDWINSNSRWTFDPMLSAVQSAAAVAGYHLTSFYLPDWDPSARDPSSPSQARGARALNESEPGAVLFRRWVPRTDAQLGHMDLLLVLVVGESAISGVYKESMTAALDLALYWRSGNAAEPVEILGPSFSGSRTSLRRTIVEVADRHGLEKGGADKSAHVPPIQLTSPNASANENRALRIRGLTAYRAVVHDDETVLKALSTYLGRLNPDWACGKGVALLKEENTAWGGGLRASGAPPDPDTDPGSRPTSAGDETVPGGPTPKGWRACRSPCDMDRQKPFECAVNIPFPAHLSRLRNAAATSKTAKAVPFAPPQDAVKLSLEEARAPTDRLPSFSPDLTAANAEAMIKGIFDAIARSDVTAIGVFATDKRDHVFLAREITQRTPHALQFTYNANLIYLHPEVSNFVRGAVVASTYPLYPRTQLLTSFEGADALRQFETPGAQGVFNGLLTILDSPSGEPLTGRMLDYRSPRVAARPGATDRAVPFAEGDCRDGNCPPVWISVVGRDAIVPLHAYDANEPPYVGLRIGDSPPYILPVGTPANESESRLDGRMSYARAPSGFIIVLLGMLAAVAWHVSSSLSRSTALTREMLSRDDRPASGSRAGSVGPRPGLLRRVARPSIRAAIARRVALVRGRDRANDPIEIERTIEYRAAFFACLVALLLALLWLGKLYWVDLQPYFPAAAAPAYVVMVVCAVVLIAMTAAYSFWPSRYPRASREARRENALSFGAVGTLTTLLFVWPLLEGVAAAPSDSTTLAVTRAIITLLIALLAFVLVAWPRPRLESVAGYVRGRRIVALVGLAAVASMAAFLCSGHDEVDALLFADRGKLLGSMVSPTTFVLFVCAAVYWWGIWTERRLDLMLLPETSVGIGELLGEQARRAGTVETIAWASSRRARLWIMLPLIVLLLLWFGYRNSFTLESQSFNWMLLVASTSVLAMMLHALFDATYFGNGLLRTLEGLGRRRLGRQFKRLAGASTGWRPSFRDVHLMDLAPFSERLDRIHANLASTAKPDFIRVRGKVARLLRRLRIADKVNPSASVSASLWAQVANTCETLRDVLSKPGMMPAGARKALPQEERRALADIEFVLLYFNALIVRDLVTKLLSGFSAVIGGLLLLMLAHLLYMFQGRAFWLAVDWAALAVTTLLAMATLIRLERDRVLSELWGTTPGKFALFGGISLRLIAYVLITLLTMFAVFFPEVGGGLLEWLQPVQRALP
jgi:hypothetical protein